jgi:hypothetical protein
VHGHVDVAVNNVALQPGDGLRRDGVNRDTKDDATLSGTTSTLTPARSTIEGSVKNPESWCQVTRF